MRGQVGEPGVGVAGGAGGEVEGVEGVEHVVAVVVGFFAGREEVEAGLFRSDGVVCACGFGFEGCGRALEDCAEEFKGGVDGGWFGFFGGGVDVAGDECVFHDFVSNFGWEGGVGKGLGWCGHDC